MPLRFAEPVGEAYRYPLTIRHLLDGALLTSPEQEIVYRDRFRYTYRDFARRVGQLASMLTGLGADQGMTVAVMDWDSHRYLEAYFAVPMMGAVLQTVNVRLPIHQVLYTLEHAKAEILLIHSDFFPMAEAILPSLPGIKSVVAIMDGAQGGLPHWARGEYEALLAVAAPDFPFEDFDENAVATTFYTTGTTGNPKGVCFTHRQLVLHTLAVNSPLGEGASNANFGVGDVYMPLTPMFHVHAWGVPYIATMLGLKQVYPGRYDPETICRLRTEHKVTFSHCVPTILQMVLQFADASGADLRGWKMTIGGAALTKALCAEARRRGMVVAAGYGMSETCPAITIARRREHGADDEDSILNDMTAAGVPIPLVKARVVDLNMSDVPHDGVSPGELVLRTPWLTPCYTNDAKASGELWRGGWLHTQDIATIDAAGCIRIRDRLKDVIKSGGEWIDSIELEELVAKAEGVAEAVVVAVPDSHWGERPLAVVVPKPGAKLTLDMLNAPVESAIAQGEITPYARLEKFEIVDRLPRTSVGKFDKKALRSLFSGATANPETRHI